MTDRRGRRDSLEAILPAVRAGFKSAPLDELLLAVCARRAREAYDMTMGNIRYDNGQ